MNKTASIDIRDTKGLVVTDGRKRSGRRRKPLNITQGQNLTPDQIVTCKLRILELMENGEARTLTTAATALGIPPLRVHSWYTVDKEFAECVRLAREIVADKLVNDLHESNNVIAKMFLLKEIRPEYREGYNISLRNPGLEKLLEEIKALRQKQFPVVSVIGEKSGQ